MHGLIEADYKMPHAALNTSHTLVCIFTPHNNPELYALIYYCSVQSLFLFLLSLYSSSSPQSFKLFPFLNHHFFMSKQAKDYLLYRLSRLNVRTSKTPGTRPDT